MENTQEEKKLTQTEYLAKLKKELDDFTKGLDGKSLEELKEIEQDVIKAIDENNEAMSLKEFNLSSKGYKNVAEGIVRLLDKKTYNWQAAFGMCALYEFWSQRPAPKTIPYAVLDTTLNTIGGLEFKGHKEGRLALEIIEYITPIRDEYANLRADSYLLSEKHNVVMNKMGLNTPIGGENQ